MVLEFSDHSLNLTLRISAIQVTDIDFTNLLWSKTISSKLRGLKRRSIQCCKSGRLMTFVLNEDNFGI